MNKTIKEIADTLNISKQRVYRYIDRNNIKEITTDKNAKYYDEKAQKIIMDHFSTEDESNTASDETADDVKTLKEDIIKRQDKEIERLSNQVETLQRIIDQQQQLELESIRTFRKNKLISSDADDDANVDAKSTSDDATSKSYKTSKGGIFRRFWHSKK